MSRAYQTPLILLLVVLGSLQMAAAQDDLEIVDEPVIFTVIVDVESGFARAKPELDAEPVASLFQDERLEVVSRNLDGQWFEVRRPGRMNNLGWVFEKILLWEFEPEKLPLGDLDTGLTGAVNLTNRNQFAVFMVEGATLRSLPSRLQGERLGNVPPNVTVPVLERNRDGSWLLVNYFGLTGWVIGFATRPSGDPIDLPLTTNPAALAVQIEGIAVIIIPPEVQLAQVNKLRDFIRPRRELARNLEIFWWSVFRGETMPCDAPPISPDYFVTAQDVRELPELQRYVPQLGTAVAYLNEAIDPLNYCGVVSPEIVGDARDAAINSRISFDAILQRLDNLEDNVIR